MKTYTKDNPPSLLSARKLMTYEMHVTSNSNNFPKKFRHSIVDNILNTTFELMAHIRIALGNQINTIVSNLYLDGMDKFITQELGIKYYGRYADDFYMIHPSKKYLKYCEDRIIEHLNNLNLSLNPKSQIMPFKNGISFLVFIFIEKILDLSSS